MAQEATVCDGDAREGRVNVSRAAVSAHRVSRPIPTITPPERLGVLRRIEVRGPLETCRAQASRDRTVTSGVRRPQSAAARAGGGLARLHGQSQTESRQNRTECVQPRVPLLGQRAVQSFPAESGFIRQRSHPA